MENAVAILDQLPQQNVVAYVALDELQLIARCAPVQIVESAETQVVEDDDFVPAPAKRFADVRANESRPTCNQSFQSIAAAWYKFLSRSPNRQTPRHRWTEKESRTVISD